MHIQKANITNIRSIRSFEINFPQPAGWHVLIGDNGAGKSSILKAIALGFIGGIHSSTLRLDWGNFITFGEDQARISLMLKEDVLDQNVGEKNNPDELDEGEVVTKINRGKGRGSVIGELKSTQSTFTMRSIESNTKLKRLGKLNILFALGKIKPEEEAERQKLQQIFTTDDPTGF